MRTVLVATDGSPHSDRAVDCAADLARASDASLVVFHVTEAPSGQAAQKLKEIEHVGEGDIPELLAHSLLAQACSRARAFGAIRISAVATTGDPAEEILSAAKRKSADMIVVGKRGRGRLAGLLLGRVSHKLVSLAACNVLVVA